MPCWLGVSRCMWLYFVLCRNSVSRYLGFFVFSWLQIGLKRSLIRHDEIVRVEGRECVKVT